MYHVISRTPYRISFFGGGTDYPDWYLKHGGSVLSMAIDKYCYISAKFLPSYFGFRHRVVWSHIEHVNSISEILHPAVRAGLVAMDFNDNEGLEIHHQGDLPARSGIGSSSAFAVGLINTLHTLRGRTVEKRELALAAIDLERNHLKETVGCQDQVASALGGLNVIDFREDGTIDVKPVGLPAALQHEFESRLMLFYTGTTRLSSALAQEFVNNLENRQKSLVRMQEMVPQALDLLHKGDFDSFGTMLHETWTLKRSLTSKVSTGMIDQIYDTARGAGALGGKLLGAGGSGFMVFIVPPEKQANVGSALSHLINVPIRTDFTGSTIVYRNPV